MGKVEFVEDIIVKRFDDIFRQEKFCKPPHVVKVDVEGAELLVLKGFGDLIRYIKYILCEVHPEKWKNSALLPMNSLKCLNLISLECI